MLLLNDVLDITDIRILPQRNEELEGIGSGQILRAEIADPLWRVEINTTISTFDNGRRIRATINDINRPQSFFRVYDPIAQYATNDPDGTLLTAVEIGDRVGNQVEFTGQPAAYMFEPGDAFHILYLGRHYYFEVSEQSSTLLRTTPTIPASIPVGTPCVFVRPQIRVQMVPTELQFGTVDSSIWKMTQFQIRAIQKL